METIQEHSRTPSDQLAGISIRAAQPDDVGPIAELMFSSGPDIYQYLFTTRNSTALDFIRHEFSKGYGFCGYKNVTVAIKDGTVVGTGCFYDRARYEKLVKGTGKNILDFFGVMGAIPVVLRTRHNGSTMKPPRDGELYLANFGVDSRLRSQGIGSLMIRHKLAEARQHGYRTFGLDVSVANPKGQALYERLGLRVTREKVFSNPKANVANCRKMELSL